VAILKHASLKLISTAITVLLHSLMRFESFVSRTKGLKHDCNMLAQSIQVMAMEVLARPMRILGSLYRIFRQWDDKG